MNIFDSNEDVKQAIETLKNLPLNQAFGDAFNDAQISEQIDFLFPGLRENPTMDGFFKSFGSMIINMNESEDYKQLRKTIQNGLNINRDKIFKSSDPYEIINESYKKNNIDARSFLPENGQYAPQWFDDISNEYLTLDLHGYQEDRVSITKKDRKETFRNTTEDAFHTAFASTCHFYLTNDKKSFEKTQKVYKKLGVNTLILTPDDFVEYHQTFLSLRNIHSELEIPFQYLESNEYDYLEDKVENNFIRSYYIPYFIFDFFNKMTVIINEEGVITTILLNQISPTNKDITYFFEIEKLSLKLNEALGIDADNLGQITHKELEQDQWDGRTWNYENGAIKFIREKCQFYLYFDYLITNK